MSLPMRQESCLRSASNESTCTMLVYVRAGSCCADMHIPVLQGNELYTKYFTLHQAQEICGSLH